MQIADICTREVVHVHHDLSVNDAAQLMRQKHIGTLVVVDQTNAERIPIGIVTDRDIVVSVVAADVEASELTVGDIMTRQLATCSESQDLFDAVQCMRTHGVRRLPVINSHGALSGMLSADDVMSALGTHLHELAQAMTHGQVREMAMRK